jgi:uncharacterized protein (TIGR02594 family)
VTFDEWVISRLREHGFYSGAYNGAPGRAMIEGLKKFQAAEGLPATGMANTDTVAALRLPGNARDSQKPAQPLVTLPAEPIWMREARRHLGIKEVPGPKANPTIIGFAKRLGGWVASYYTSDETPWCGLGMGYCIAVTLPQEALPGNPLSALAWKTFGLPLVKPCLGAILVFSRTGGGHVGYYVGEDDTHFHVLGFNQANSVTITRIDKSRLVGIRWPRTGPAPAGRPVVLTSSGVPVSVDEA